MHVIIYTDRYDADAGGVSALYELGRRLKFKGVHVSVWLRDRPNYTISYLISCKWDLIRIAKQSIRYYSSKICLPFNLLETRRINKSFDVVVYPEVVNGNPLGVERVARWILFFPGALSKKPIYGPKEKFFHWSSSYNNRLVPKSSQRLRLPLIHQTYYRNLRLPRKNSALVLVRKGRKRNLDSHPPHAIPIDGKSHEEISYLFNTSERLYSYDPYTAYLVYAMLCGCIPVVIPLDGKTEEDCYPDPEERLGLAYGEEGIEFATLTREVKLEMIEKENMLAEMDVDNFLEVFR